MKLTHKRASKELETSLEVIRCLIGVARDQIKSEPNEEQWQKELHQLYGVENILEQADDFYYEEVSDVDKDEVLENG
jgi:hypothetical protein